MRVLLLLAVLSFAVVAAPAPAQAHVEVCDFGDAVCLAECEQDHFTTWAPHECGIRRP